MSHTLAEHALITYRTVNLTQYYAACTITTTIGLVEGQENKTAEWIGCWLLYSNGAAILAYTSKLAAQID